MQKVVYTATATAIIATETVSAVDADSYTPIYCDFKAKNANNLWIQSIKLGYINNISGKNNGGYSYYTNLTKVSVNILGLEVGRRLI